jgi:hypothetical protein
MRKGQPRHLPFRLPSGLSKLATGEDGVLHEEETTEASPVPSTVWAFETYYRRSTGADMR